MDPSKPLNIVRLDGIHTPAPFFSPTFKHTYSSYDYTSSDDTLIISRLLDADVCITTRVPITSATVTVCNVPAASNESVAEQAIALFFALRRNVVRMHGLTSMGSLWGEKMTLKSEFGECPRTCRGEVVGILGGGELGKVTG
jgi:lactate dehydrogenase-like 2-hydroxyacid dehydrogenase